MGRHRPSAPLVLALLGAWSLLAQAAGGATVQVVASRDNTLYEDEDGALSNGAGAYLFVGNTSQTDPGLDTRRALVRFDLAGAVPTGSVVTAATLTLYVSRAPSSASFSVGVHRVLADWGESGSNDAQNEGNGAPAQHGDATWLHTSFDHDTWGTPGGDFVAAASAATAVGPPAQSYAWSSPQLRADVQAWVDDPASNFGWLMRGDESAPRTTKRFNSREDTSSAGARRPSLSITFTPPAGTGGCCSAQGGCSLVTASQCSSQGGVFQGAGGSCSPNPCPQPSGACCIAGGSCQRLTASACLAQAGTYRGDGTTCAGAGCGSTSGACCLPGNPGSCAARTAAACAGDGGAFLGSGSVCGVDLCPFVDALTVPPVAQPISGSPGGAATYALRASEEQRQLHRDLPPSKLWTYGGDFPGPTIEARTGQAVHVQWTNDLRDDSGALRTDHLLPVDACLHGPDHLGTGPRTVTHLHGGHVPPPLRRPSRGHAAPGRERPVRLPQPAAAGDALVPRPRARHHPAERLPRPRRDVPAARRARGVPRPAAGRARGAAGDPGPLLPRRRVPGLSGGMAGALLRRQGAGQRQGLALPGGGSRQVPLPRPQRVERAGLPPVALRWGDLPPDRHRRRPAAGARAADRAHPHSGRARRRRHRLRVVPTGDRAAPGQRRPGALPRHPRARSRRRGAGAARGIGGRPRRPLPAELRALEVLREADAVRTRTFELTRRSEPCAGAAWTINGLEWEQVTEYPVLGTTEIWRFVNRSGMTHPMHLHLVMFQVLDRQPFTLVNGQVTPVGGPSPPPPNERGWKDTVAVYPFEIVRVIARFTTYPGLYAYHCHVLEHEDHEMMRQFQVVGSAAEACVPDEDTLCLDDVPGDRRFRVEIDYATARAGGLAGKAHAISLADRGIRRGGLFWFFSADNPELLVKVLNGCALNDRFWVFFSAGTDVGITLRVTDTVTGRQFLRSSPDGTPVPTVQDTAALPCNP